MNFMGCFTLYIFFTLLILLPLIFAEVLAGAFLILGFSHREALLILVSVIFGSAINIPIVIWDTDFEYSETPFKFDNLFSRWVRRPEKKILAVNLGGAIIPGLLSLWQIKRLLTEFVSSHPHGFGVFIFVLLLNIYVSYSVAKPVPNRGITIPALIPPFTVAIPSIILAPSIAPVIAFPAGVLGVLIGADILNINRIKEMPGPGGSIGGAGTFDGVFLSGVLSVFLTG